MSKYRRKKKSNSFLGILAVIAVVVFLVVENPQLLIAILAATVIVCLVVGVLFFLRKRNTAPVEMTQEESFPMQERQYFAKASLLTPSEQTLYQKLLHIVGIAYIVQAQVPLSSVVEKQSESKYRNELFRVLDYGIFDKEWRPLVMVELNDPTHKNKDRRERDLKVQAILQEAGIPLLTLHTSYPNEETYIRKRLSEHIPALATEVIATTEKEEV